MEPVALTCPACDACRPRRLREWSRPAPCPDCRHTLVLRLPTRMHPRFDLQCPQCRCVHAPLDRYVVGLGPFCPRCDYGYRPRPA